jgi:hypothetical protein
MAKRDNLGRLTGSTELRGATNRETTIDVTKTNNPRYRWSVLDPIGVVYKSFQ